MQKKVLVIAAHPDDEIYGMGGTIAKLTSNGCEVHLLIVTDGSSSQYRNANDLDTIIKTKKAETALAAKAVGISSITYGNLPDMRLDITPHVEVNSVIEDTIERLQPDTVFTHFWGDVNLDHQCVYRSTVVAVRPAMGQCVKWLYCYSVPSSTEWMPFTQNTIFTPNTFVDISGYADRKAEAIKCYKTELRQYPHPRSVAHVQKQDIAEGLKVGIAAAESFILMRHMVE